eukprot:tig00000157_g9635.t1
MRTTTGPRSRERIVGATVVIFFVLGIFTITMSTGMFGSERRKKEKAFNLCKELTGDPGYVSSVLIDVRDEKGKWMPSLRGFDLKPGEVKRYDKSICNCGKQVIWFRTTLSGSREQRELASIYSQSPWEGRVRPGLCEEITMIFNGNLMSHEWPETFTVGTYTEANDPVLSDHDSYRVRIVRSAGDLWSREYGVQLQGANAMGQWFVTVDNRNQANVSLTNTDTNWYSWRLYVLPDDSGQQCMDWLEADAYEGVVPAGSRQDIWISAWPQEGCFGKCRANLKLELNNTLAPEITFSVGCVVVADLRVANNFANYLKPKLPPGSSGSALPFPGRPAPAGSGSAAAAATTAVASTAQPASAAKLAEDSFISDSYQDSDGAMRARWELCKARMDYGQSKVVKEFLKNNGKDEIWWEATPVVQPRQIGGQPCFAMEPTSGSLKAGEEATVTLRFNASGIYDDEYFDESSFSPIEFYREEDFYGSDFDEDGEPPALSFGSGRFPNLCSWYFVNSNDPGLRGYRHWFLELNPVGMSVANAFVDTAAEQIIITNTASRPFSWTIAAIPDLGPPMKNMEGVTQRSVNLIVFEALAGELEPFGTRAVRFQMVPHAAESLTRQKGNVGAFLRPRFSFVTTDPHNPAIPFNIHFSQVATPVERDKADEESWFPSKSDQRKSAVKVNYRGADNKLIDIVGGASLVVPIGEEVVITKTIINNEEHSIWWKAYPDTLQVTSNKPRLATPWADKVGLTDKRDPPADKVVEYIDLTSGTITSKKKQTIKIRINATAYGAGTELLACVTLDGNDPAIKKFECFDIHIPEPPGVAIRIGEVTTPSRAANAAASSAAAAGRLVVGLHRMQEATAKVQLINLNPNTSFTWTATFGPHRYWGGIRWLRLAGDHAGTLEPSASKEIEIALDSTSLEEDKSQSVGVRVIFETSDPAHPKVSLPVSLYVDPTPIYVEPDFYTFPKPQETVVVNLDNATWTWRMSLRGLLLGSTSGAIEPESVTDLPFRCVSGLAQVTLAAPLAPGATEHVRDEKGKWMPSLRGFDLKPGEVKRYDKSICNCGKQVIWFRTTLSGSREQRELASIYSQSPWEGRVRPGLCEEITMIFNGNLMSHEWPETFTVGTYTEANDPVLSDHDSYRVRIVRSAGDLWSREYGVQLQGANAMGQWFVTVDNRNQANVSLTNTDTNWYSWRLYVLPDDSGQQCMDWLEADAYEGVVPAGSRQDIWISAWPQEGCFGKCRANLKLELNNTLAPEITFSVGCVVVADLRVANNFANYLKPKLPPGSSGSALPFPGRPAPAGSGSAAAAATTAVASTAQPASAAKLAEDSFISDSYQDSDGAMRARWELCKARMDYGQSKVVKEFLKNNGKDEIWWEATPVVQPRQIGGQPCFAMEPTSGSLKAGEEATVTLRFNASGIYDDEYFDESSFSPIEFYREEDFYGSDFDEDGEPPALSFGSGRFPNLCSWYFVNSNDPGLRGYRHWFLELNPVGMSVANAFVDTAAEQIIITNTASRPFSWTIAAIPDLGPPMKNMEGVTQRSVNLIVFEALAGELEPFGTRAVRFQMVPHAAESLTRQKGNVGAFLRPRFSFVTTDPHNPAIPFNIHFSQVATPVERDKADEESWFPSKSDQRKSAVKVNYRGADNKLIDIVGGASLVVPIGEEVVITKTIINNEEHSIWWKAYPDTLQVTSNKPRLATPWADKVGLTDKRDPPADKVVEYIDLTSGTITSKKKQTIKIRINATAYGAGTELLACVTLDGNDPAIKKFECFDIHIPEPPGVAIRIGEVTTPSRAANAAASSAAAAGRLVVGLHRMQEATAKVQLINLNPNTSFTWTATFGPHRYWGGIRWLRLAGDHAGTLEPSASKEIEIALDSTSLEEDKSQSVGVRVIFETSDPAHPKVSLPVSLYVDPTPIYVEPDFYTFPKPQETVVVNLDNATWTWRMVPAPFLGQSLRGLLLGSTSGAIEPESVTDLPFRCVSGLAQVTLQLMFEGGAPAGSQAATATAAFSLEAPAVARSPFGRPGVSTNFGRPGGATKPYLPDPSALGYRTESLFVDCVDPAKVTKATVASEPVDEADTPTLVVEETGARRGLRSAAPAPAPTKTGAAKPSKAKATPKATPTPTPPTPTPSPTPLPTGPRCEVSYKSGNDAGDAARVRTLQPGQQARITRTIKNLDEKQEIAWNVTSTLRGVLDAYSGSVIDLSSPFHAQVASRVAITVSVTAAAGVVPPKGEASVDIVISRGNTGFTADEKRSLWFHYFFVCFDISAPSPDLVGLDCLYAVPAEQKAQPGAQAAPAIPVKPVAPPLPAEPEFYPEGFDGRPR